MAWHPACTKWLPDSDARRGAGLRPLRYALAILTAALGDAVREELIARNVAALVQPPRKTEAPVRSLDEEEARKVVAVALVDRMAPTWLVLLALGLRKGEALALRWEALDLDAGTLAIQRKQRRRRAGIDQETGRQRWELVEDEYLKTKGSKAVLALPNMVVTVLREHERRQDQAREKATKQAEKLGVEGAVVWADDGLVFTTAAGRPIDPRNVNRWWDVVCEQAGVRRGTARSMDGILTRLHAPAVVTDGDHQRGRRPARKP